MNDGLKENRLRGNAAFPIVLYEMPHDNLSVSAAVHWQEDVEVLFVKRGEIELTLDSTQLILHAEEIVWINPGQLHGFRGLCPEAQCDILIFPIHHLLFEREDHDQQKYLRPLAEGKLGFPLHLPENSITQQLTRQIIDLQRHKPRAFELMTKALLLQLIWHLAQTDEFVPLRPAKHDDVCKQILTYIHQHYMERITVSDIAAAVAISPKYFSTFFAEHFFQHFTEYLRSYRIEQACALLANTSMTIADVALTTGFSSSSHFIQNFRTVKGMTPFTYRQGMKHTTPFD